MLEVLLQRKQERNARNEALRLKVREDLRLALAKFVPGEAVYVFGSLTKPGKYHEWSDVDLAFLEEPKAIHHYQLISELMDELHRSVNVLVLSESRLREKILREGELWTS